MIFSLTSIVTTGAGVAILALFTVLKIYKYQRDKLIEKDQVIERQIRSKIIRISEKVIDLKNAKNAHSSDFCSIKPHADRMRKKEL